MNFTDVERDVHKLIGLELNSISRSAAITIENIDDEQERLIIRPKNGNSRSRPIDIRDHLYVHIQAPCMDY